MSHLIIANQYGFDGKLLILRQTIKGLGLFYGGQLSNTKTFAWFEVDTHNDTAINGFRCWEFFFKGKTPNECSLHNQQFISHKQLTVLHKKTHSRQYRKQRCMQVSLWTMDGLLTTESQQSIAIHDKNKIPDAFQL